MNVHLVTGYAGMPHVTSDDAGVFNAGTIGVGDYVLNTGTKMAASIISNNIIRISDGDAILQGRHVNLKSGTYEDVTISNGVQDMQRNDLIVLQYEKETASGIENVYLTVLQGTPVAGNAEDPVPTVGNILAGDTLHEMPLYRVHLNGLTVESVTPLFNTIDSMEGLAALVAGQADTITKLTTRLTKAENAITEQNGTLSGVTDIHWTHLGRVNSLNHNLPSYHSGSKKMSIITALCHTGITDGSKCPVEGIVITYMWDSASYAVQMCYGLSHNTDHAIYKRLYYNGWKEWVRVDSVELEKKYLLVEGSVTVSIKSGIIGREIAKHNTVSGYTAKLANIISFSNGSSVVGMLQPVDDGRLFLTTIANSDLGECTVGYRVLYEKNT